MAFKLYLDKGHGGKDPGASGNGLVEKYYAELLGNEIRDIILAEYEDVEVRESRTADQTRTLDHRTNDANRWGADFLLSVHANAFNGTAKGYEDFVHDTKASAKSKEAQANIHAEVMKVSGMVDRGEKQANFHMLRESKMPAVLGEFGFIDNAEDADKMRTKEWRTKIAKAVVLGIAKTFNLIRKASVAVRYTLQTGGLAPSKLKEFSEFLHKNNIGWTAVCPPGESARVKIEGLTPSQKTIVSNFLNGQSWFYGLSE